MGQDKVRMKAGLGVAGVLLGAIALIVGMFLLTGRILQARSKQLEQVPAPRVQSTLIVHEGQSLEGYKLGLPRSLQKNGAIYRLDKVEYQNPPGTVLNKNDKAGEGGIWRTFTETRTQTMSAEEADSPPSTIQVEEEGFEGELELETSSKTPVLGTYQVQVDHQVTFSDLPDNDVSRLPETYVFPLTGQSGYATFTRAAVTYQESAWDELGIPTSFQATVTYRGLENRTRVDSYQVESVYTGEVFRAQDYQAKVSYLLDEEATAAQVEAASAPPLWAEEIPGMVTLYRLKDQEGWRGVVAFGLLLFATLAAALVAILLILRRARCEEQGARGWTLPPLTYLERPSRHLSDGNLGNGDWDEEETLSTATLPVHPIGSVTRGA